MCMDDARKSLLECISLVLDYVPMREGIAEALELTVEQVNPSLVNSPEWPTLVNTLADYVEAQFIDAEPECVASLEAEGVLQSQWGDPDYHSYIHKLGPIFKVTENIADLSCYCGSFEDADVQLGIFADALFDAGHGAAIKEWRFDQPTDETGTEANEDV